MFFQLKTFINYSKVIFLLYLSTYGQAAGEKTAIQGNGNFQKKRESNSKLDNRDNFLCLNQNPSLPFLNEFYKESVCEFAREEKSFTIKPISKKQQKKEVLLKKISKFMKYSPAFLKKYKIDQSFLKKATEETEQLFSIMMENPDSYCQLESVCSKDNDKFEITLCLFEELKENGKQNMAHYRYTTDENNYYSVVTNTVSLAPELWVGEKADLRQVLEIFNHEITHAFNAYQNLKKSILDPLPCDISILKNGEARRYCGEIQKILNLYQANLRKLTDIFVVPLNQRSKEDQKLLKEFTGLTKSYQPRRYEARFPVESINMLKKQGRLKHNLEIISKPIYLDSIVDFSNKAKPIAIHNIKDSKTGHFLATWGFDINDDMVQACLEDLKRWNNTLNDLYSNDILTYIEELDAGLNGILTQYPALYDFMLPGMREYKVKRSNDLYQQCINAADEPLSLSF